MNPTFFPEPATCDCNCRPATTSRSTMTGTASSSAHPRTIAAPIPFAPPVIKTTLPLICKSIRVRLQIVKSSRIFTKNLLPSAGRVPIHIVLDDLSHLLVAPSQKAHGPIRPKHQSVYSKRLEHDVEIRIEISRRPAPPVRFGHQSRQLAIHVR